METRRGNTPNYPFRSQADLAPTYSYAMKLAGPSISHPIVAGGESRITNGRHHGQSLDELLSRYPAYQGLDWAQMRPAALQVGVQFLGAGQKPLAPVVSTVSKLWIVQRLTDRESCVWLEEDDSFSARPVQAGSYLEILSGQGHSARGVELLEISHQPACTRPFSAPEGWQQSTSKGAPPRHLPHWGRPLPPSSSSREWMEGPIDAVTLLTGWQDFILQHIGIAEQVFYSFCNHNSFQILLCIQGQGRLQGARWPAVKVSYGQAVFLPAGLGDYQIEGDSQWLRVRLAM